MSPPSRELCSHRGFRPRVKRDSTLDLDLFSCSTVGYWPTLDSTKHGGGGRGDGRHGTIRRLPPCVWLIQGKTNPPFFNHWARPLRRRGNREPHALDAAAAEHVDDAWRGVLEERRTERAPRGRDDSSPSPTTFINREPPAQVWHGVAPRLHDTR